ncbi:MAG: hypothetical protein ACKOPE_03845 [Novosphingobium sp.]
MAFFAADIDEAVNKLKPAVEQVLIERGIPTSRILVNVGDPKHTTNDDERAFRRLDYPESDKQFIILVNKGREGWNCRSLFGVALFRKPNSKIFVLQASMRCLRSIGDVPSKVVAIAPKCHASGHETGTETVAATRIISDGFSRA